MKIAIESSNCVKQNEAGGIQMRIGNYYNNLIAQGMDVVLFDKWNHKVSDFDILHIFKVNYEDYRLVQRARESGTAIVISSVIPIGNSSRIAIGRLLGKLHIHTPYYFFSEMLKMADAILPQTNLEKKFIHKHYKVPTSKLHVIPNGVNEAIQNGDPELIRNHFNLSRKTVLCVGRFDTNKNQLSLVKALRDIDIPIVFVGGADPFQNEYYQQCINEADQNMHFTGWLDNQSPLLASAYANAQVVVLLSHQEIFGNSLIEGGSVGANLVATDVLPISDWGIGEYCKTVNVKQIANIRDTIVSEYNRPLKHETAKIFMEKFSWGAVTEMHLSVYKQVLKK